MRICVGQILGAHGVKGLVKLASYTNDPEAIAGYGETKSLRPHVQAGPEPVIVAVRLHPTGIRLAPLLEVDVADQAFADMPPSELRVNVSHLSLKRGAFRAEPTDSSLGPHVHGAVARDG